MALFYHFRLVAKGHLLSTKNTDQGAVMKKSFLVLMLAAVNYGCSTPAVTQVDNHALIGYDEIAAEIKVSFQTASGSDEWSRPVTANLPNAE